jgi:hypothetical protein
VLAHYDGDITRVNIDPRYRRKAIDRQRQACTGIRAA